MENSPNQKVSKWNELYLFFSERFNSPIEHPEYILYFIIIIIGLGGISIWTSLFVEYHEFIFNNKNVIGNLLTFSVAILATGSIEMMFV